MAMQVSHRLAPSATPALPAEGRGPGCGPVVLVAGAAGLGSDAAHRLLERALADSGLAVHEPAGARAGSLPPAHWRRRGVQPRLVVAFGAEAAAELLRRPVSLALERGKVRAMPDGGRLLVTEHPKEILRQSDPVARGREYRRLVNDLLMAVPHRRRLAA
jgi:hypothetical protein